MSIRLTLLLFPILLISCATTEETVHERSADEVHQKLADLFVIMPASTPKEEIWLNEQLNETGPEGIRALAGMLTSPGTGDDTYARYALSSLATYVSRPGADSQREEFESILLEELRNDHPVGAKEFMINQLEEISGNNSVPLMTEFLNHESLFNPALDILVTIETPRALQAIRQALEDAEGQRKVAIIKALGDLQDGTAAERIVTHANSESWPVRRVSLYALSNIGDPVASEVFSEAIASAGPDRESDILSFYMTYADRLAQRGHESQSAEICRAILDGDYPAQVQSSALSVLFQTQGRQMLDELMELGLSPNARISDAALSHANKLEGAEVTNAFAANMNRASAERRATILAQLGKRGDESVVSAITPYLEDSNGKVRTAAAEALYRLGGSDHLPVIVEALNRAEDDQERESLQAILLQMPTQELLNESRDALPGAAESAKPVLIRILALRGSPENLPLIVQQANSDYKEVRLEVYHALQLWGWVEDLDILTGNLMSDLDKDEITAIQQAFVSITNRIENTGERTDLINRIVSESSDAHKPLLLATLPEINGASSNLATGALTSADENIRTAAMLALAEWRDPAALPDLLEAAGIAPDSLRDELNEGYVRLVSSSSYPRGKQSDLLCDLAETADTPRQKAASIQAFSMADDLVALQSASRYFSSDEEAVSSTALEVASGIVGPFHENGTTGFTISNAVLAVLDDPARTGLLEKIKQQAETDAGKEVSESEAEDEEQPVYGEIFNGRNLHGWQVIGQDPDNWGAENGVLYTEGAGGGWISTEAQYDDFIIELEYRVPEGGNSGVFLRAPHEGNPAFAGMEIQILDDYADQYADLEPYQYTGSIYNVKAPSKRVTQPAGEWQSMVIKADGPRIMVSINDELVVNTSLINHMELADGHPGLTKRSGYIGLQDHSSRVDFRNIYIHEVE